jgi:hypothetical protein
MIPLVELPKQPTRLPSHVAASHFYRLGAECPQFGDFPPCVPAGEAFPARSFVGPRIGQEGRHPGQGLVPLGVGDTEDVADRCDRPDAVMEARHAAPLADAKTISIAVGIA